MSQLDIHLDAVRGIAQQLERAANRLSQTTQSLSALRTSLDGAIQSRRDIGRRLQAAYNHATDAERRTRQLASFLLEAVGRYGDAEDGLNRQARGIPGLPVTVAGGTGDPKRSIDWASLWDNLGHYLLEYMNQLKEERYNIDGIDWSKVPPNMVDQIKASIDAAARQQAEASAGADTLDDVLHVGGYTLEGPEHTRYYVDMNDNQLLVDSERMLELIDSYNRAFRTNLHTPDVAILMNMDVTEFLRYAMEQGYDPRTFQPLRDSDIREIEGYITARQQLSEEHHRQTRAWQSEALGWIPGISAVKEAADVLAGKDVLTGEPLTKLDYGLAALSAFGPLGKGGKKVVKFAADKIMGKADEVVDSAGKLDQIVKPSKFPSPDAVPSGTKTKINPKNDAETIRSLKRENESADILAKHGYDIKQNPAIQTTNKNPDYLIEGQIFDCYAPSKNTSVRSIWSNIKVSKVDAGQTDRVILNLKDWSGNIDDLKKQFSDYPMDGLKEVIVITKDDTVINLIP